MKNKKVTAGVLTASMLAPMAAQFAPVTVIASERENCDAVYWRQDRDCRDNSEVTQGLSFRIQNTDHPYEHVGLKIYRLPDTTEIGGTDNKGGATLDGVKADKYDLSQAEQVASIHSIGDVDGIWINPDGSVHELDKDMGEIGCNTCISLPAGKYVLVHDEEGGAFGSGDKYKTVPFIVGDDKSSDTQGTMVDGKIATLDIECIKSPDIKLDKGAIQIQAVVVETDENGNINKDADGNFILTGEKVPGVKVSTKVSFSIFETKTLEMITDENGLNTIENIPISPITALNPTYASILEYPEGWELADPDNDKEFTFDVKAGETAVHVIELYKIPEGDGDNPENPTEIPQTLRVVVVDKDTGVEVEGAGFSVVAKNNPDFTFEGTSKNGGVDKTSVLVDTYTGAITSVPDGYKLNTDTVSVTLVPVTEEGKVTEIRLVIEKGDAVGALKTLVRDKDTKEPIPGATVEIIGPDGTVIDTIITGEDGTISKGDLPAGDYTIKVTKVPDGYTAPADQTAKVEVNKVANNIFELEKGKGTLDVIVRDKDTKDPIPGATVVIKDKDGNIIDTVVTDENGKVHKPDLPEGDYTVEVIEVPEGYTPPDPQEVTIEKDKTSELIFELDKGNGALDVIVRDKDTKEPIPGATVEIIGPDGKVITTVVTDKDGKVNKSDLPEGEYTIKVTKVPDGYTAPEDQTAIVKKGETTQKIFELEKGKGNLEVIVRDKDTKEPIPGATVEIVDKDGKVIKTVTTNSEGKVTEKDLPVGDYTVKVTKVPDGYTAPEDQTATIKKGETTQKIFELEKGVGALSVLVRDKDTKDPIPGAKVQILDKNGKVILETTTNKEGRLEKDKLPAGDYTIKVIEVPEGYTKPANTVAPVKVGKKTNVIFELEKGRGNLEVTIRDKDTKKPIPGALVQVVDKNGTLITELRTDENGQIKKENLPIGDYTIKVKEVPEGYKIPTDEKATVKKNETAKVLIELEKGVGALEVIVRDKNTKEPIPGAKVQVLDKDGKVVLETTTDKNGRIEKDKMPIGDYTIKVLEVPDGYNLPNNQKITIKRSVKTTVIFELEKNKNILDDDVPKSNIVQTGDNNNIFGLISAGIASVAGMIFVSKKNKKDE